jgi:hypothetical protein
MPQFVASRQLQIFVRRPPRFLDKSMQQHHSASLVDIKKHSRNSVLREARPNFVEALTQRPANRHPDWPPEFHRLDVFTDAFAILGRASRLQPIPNWFSASVCPKEDHGNALAGSLERL